MEKFTNQNIAVPMTIRVLILSISAFNFILAIFVIQFQIRHPETRMKFGNFFLVVLLFEAISALCYISSYAWVYNLERVSYEVKNEDITEFSFLTHVCIYTGYI